MFIAIRLQFTIFLVLSCLLPDARLAPVSSSESEEKSTNYDDGPFQWRHPDPAVLLPPDHHQNHNLAQFLVNRHWLYPEQYQEAFFQRPELHKILQSHTKKALASNVIDLRKTEGGEKTELSEFVKQTNLLLKSRLDDDTFKYVEKAWKKSQSSKFQKGYQARQEVLKPNPKKRGSYLKRKPKRLGGHATTTTYEQQWPMLTEPQLTRYGDSEGVLPQSAETYYHYQPQDILASDPITVNTSYSTSDPAAIHSTQYIPDYGYFNNPTMYAPTGLNLTPYLYTTLSQGPQLGDCDRSYGWNASAEASHVQDPSSLTMPPQSHIQHDQTTSSRDVDSNNATWLQEEPFLRFEDEGNELFASPDPGQPRSPPVLFDQIDDYIDKSAYGAHTQQFSPHLSYHSVASPRETFQPPHRSTPSGSSGHGPHKVVGFQFRKSH